MCIRDSLVVAFAGADGRGARPGGGGGGVEVDRAVGEEGAGGGEAGIAGFGAACVVGQFAVEVGGVRGVVADAAGGAEPGEGAAYALRAQSAPGGEVGGVDARLPGEQHGHEVGVGGRFVGGQRLQDGALAGEPAAGFRGEGEGQAHAGQGDLPGGGGGGAVRGGGPVDAQCGGVPQHALQGGEAFGAGQADGPGDGAGGGAQGAAGGDHPQGAPAARAGAGGGGAREGAQEPYGLGGGQFGAQVEAGGDHLGLGEAAQPAVGQRDLLLHHGSVGGGDGQFVGADPQVQGFVAAQPGQGLAQRVVDVDVGGAVAGVGAVESFGEYVEPGVDPAAAGEGLEAQPVAARGDDRVQGGPQGALVVAGGGDVRDGEQAPGGGLRRAQEPGEELRVGLAAHRGQPAGGLQPEAAGAAFGGEGGRACVGECLDGSAHGRKRRGGHRQH